MNDDIQKTKTKPVEARRLKGFKDYLPAESELRQHIISVVRNFAATAGFCSIDTPSLEYSDVLLGSSGSETDKEVYMFEDNGGRSVALRFDLTVPFARFVSEHYGELIFPFKRVQIAEVWRGEKPQKGRYRQFCQADMDVVGSDSLYADIEIINLFRSILSELIGTLSSFSICLGNRPLLSSLINKTLLLSDQAQEADVLIALDKLAKMGTAHVKQLLLNMNFDEAKIAVLLDVLCNKPDGKNTDLKKVAQIISGDERGELALSRFEKTIFILQSLNSSSSCNLVCDLSIARGLGYYTGIVFETNIDKLNGFGSVSSGGRYDKLVSRFGKQDLSGVGGSIGVDRLLAAIYELSTANNSNFNFSTERKKVFIAIATEDAISFGFEILNEIRKLGITCDITMKDSKLAAQFKYASKMQFDFVITIGSDELASRTFNFKNMATSQEDKNIAIAELVATLKKNIE
jgi:histidyl-tRNA synthetase